MVMVKTFAKRDRKFQFKKSRLLMIRRRRIGQRMVLGCWFLMASREKKVIKVEMGGLGLATQVCQS